MMPALFWPKAPPGGGVLALSQHTYDVLMANEEAYAAWRKVYPHTKLVINRPMPRN